MPDTKAKLHKAATIVQWRGDREGEGGLSEHMFCRVTCTPVTVMCRGNTWSLLLKVVSCGQ